MTITVTVNTTTPLRRLASPYLNFNIDTGSIYNDFDWTDPVLINLVYALNPLNSNGGVVIRVGGTAVDYSYYVPDAPSTNGGNGHTVYNNQLLEDMWSFAGQAHATILFDFNGLSFRNTTAGAFGPWDPTGNATAILDYLQSQHAGSTHWAWSIGNEPDLWPLNFKNYTQLGVDAHTLAATLKQYELGTNIFGPSFAGPSATNVQEYLQGANGAVTGVTVHNYPLGRDCNVTAYLNAKPAVEQMGASLAAVAAVRDSMSRGTQLVLEETAGSYGGGCENITDRYVDGFFWLNALGVTASNGFDKIHRQDVAGWSFADRSSHYMLAGPAGWTNGSALLRPHPDWFTSVLFKTIVGNSILNSSFVGTDPATTAAVSVHAWCSGTPWWYNMSMVLTFTNPTGVDVVLDLQAVNITTVGRTEYILTSTAAGYTESRARLAAGQLRTPATAQDIPDSLTADAVFLNGQAWDVDSNGILPDLPVVGNTVTDPSQPMLLPPYSYGFLQFAGATTHSC